MKSTPVSGCIATIAVDLAKQVFQLACVDAEFRVVRSLRLKRADFIAFWANLPLGSL
jgi:hypothetical protein